MLTISLVLTLRTFLTQFYPPDNTPLKNNNYGNSLLIQDSISICNSSHQAGCVRFTIKIGQKTATKTGKINRYLPYQRGTLLPMFWRIDQTNNHQLCWKRAAFGQSQRLNKISNIFIIKRPFNRTKPFMNLR